MNKLERICVFCGSSPNIDERYYGSARELAAAFAAERLTLVYGGARRGTMGVLADEMLARGGTVIGVIPDWLVHEEIAHTGLTELHIVTTMHERKQKMFELSDAFIALPGGVGTLDELFEILSWYRLGLHCKPSALLDVGLFFAELQALLDKMVHEGFLSECQRDALMYADTPAHALEKLRSFAQATSRLG